LKGRDSFNLYSSPVRHTLSNAWVMSKNAAEQYCLRSRVSFIRSTILCVCSIVECLCLFDGFVLIDFFSLLRGVFLREAFRGLWI
jgi:hypothetical protein